MRAVPMRKSPRETPAAAAADTLRAKAAAATAVVAAQDANAKEASMAPVLMALERIMGDSAFNFKLDCFIDEHCHMFDDEEENKLEYTPVFEQYVAMVEAHVEEQLELELEGFDMANFCTSLVERQSEGEVLPLVLENLAAMADFEAFKRLVISAKPLASHFGAVCCTVGSSIISHYDADAPVTSGEGAGDQAAGRAREAVDISDDRPTWAALEGTAQRGAEPASWVPMREQAAAHLVMTQCPIWQACARSRPRCCAASAGPACRPPTTGPCSRPSSSSLGPRPRRAPACL